MPTEPQPVQVTVDRTLPAYPYVQVADQVRAAIRDGTITGMLPSLAELAAQSGLSVGTVRRALQVLAVEGLIETKPGRGTFVR